MAQFSHRLWHALAKDQWPVHSRQTPDHSSFVSIRETLSDSHHKYQSALDTLDTAIELSDSILLILAMLFYLGTTI